MKRLIAATFALFLVLTMGGTLAACSSGHGAAGPVSRTQAGTIATNAYGGTVKEVESDDYKGKDVWEGEVRNSDRGRIEAKVDKSSGKILNVEQDED